ncbi:MAG: ROK family protein, partial [Myxococcaceae bacterium]
MVASLGIDLGGTFARAAVVGARGELVASAKHTLTDRSPEAVVEAIGMASERALALAPGVEVSGCGVGVAAQLDLVKNSVRVAPNIGWRDVPLGALLERRLKKRVVLINDLKAACYGEFVAGAGRGARDLLMASVGSGVGSAAIVNAQLVLGSHGVAGELGHIKVVAEGGRRCGCGEYGCLEAYAGGMNLIAQAKEAVSAGRSPKLAALSQGEPSGPLPPQIEEAAHAGDAAAREIYDRAVSYLSVAFANIVTVFNPARLILGGGVMAHCPRMRKAIEDGVLRYTSMTSRVGFSVVDAQLGDDSGVVGA